MVSKCRWAMLLMLGAAAAPAFGWEDHFDAKTLHARWRWRVPAPGPTVSLQERPGWLRIRVPKREGGYNHWSEPRPVDEAPQLRTPAPDGDWELEARFQLQEVDPESHFQAGLFAGVSDSVLLTLGPFQGPNLPGGPKVPEAWLEPTGLSGFFRVPGEARDLRLRMMRTGNVVRAFISRKPDEWVDAGTYLLPQPRFVGIIGKTFSSESPVLFDVDYVRLTPVARPPRPPRRAVVAVGGEYPTGYRGLLARLGIPHEVLLDHQLADLETLRRFDLVVIGGLVVGNQDQAFDALTRYVREGGTAVVDFSRVVPRALSATWSGYTDTSHLPDVVVGGEGNPLLPWLGDKTRFPPGESRFYFEPGPSEGCQVLARFEGHPRPGQKPRPAEGYTGAPALWVRPLGRGILVCSRLVIGATLSWGPHHDALAEALLQCIAGGRLEPQLVPEGARFGRSQNAITEKGADDQAADEPGLPEFSRRRLAATPEPLPPQARLLEEDTPPEFDLSGTYDPRQGRARLLLNYHSRAFHVSVLFEPTRALLTRMERGRSVTTATVALDGTAPIPFLLKERRERIVLWAGGRRATLGANGLWEGRVAVVGAAASNVRYQPVEPALFSDDFARADTEQGAWEVASGEWSLRALGDARMGANPFTYAARARGAGLSLAGWPFWDDYAFAVSVRPTAGGRVGQAFYLQDPRNYLLFRAHVCDAPRQEKDGLQLVRVADGQETILARRDGCLVKGHWYRLSVQVRDDRVSACVDGEGVASAATGTFAGGRIALYVQDGQAEFDDVDVRPAAEAAAPVLAELDGAVPRFAGTLDRDTWAGTALQWQADRDTGGLFWRRGRFYGDFALSFQCRFGEGASAGAPRGSGLSASPPPVMSLVLAPDAGDPHAGYRLTLQPAGAPQAGQRRYTVALVRQGKVVGRREVRAGERPVLELQRRGQRLLAMLDGRPVLQHPCGEPKSQLSRLGFLAQGFRPRISGLRLRAGNVLDYCFDRAPTDWWVASGTWELAARWPCTPEWSWFAGESRDVAAIWHKRVLTGDVLLELHIGPRTVDHGDGSPREICRAFNAVLCGDGQDVRSGYSFVVGADQNGAGATLSRNGQVVARNPDLRFYSDAHNQWICVRAEKRGNQIALWVGDQKLLSWEDPNPLPGGRVAIWTRDNAVMIPRATIYYQ